MATTQKTGLQKAVHILLFLSLGVAGLILAKEFLAPICFAGLFAMLFLPLAQKLERTGFNKGLAALICVITLLAALTAIVLLVTWQVSNLTSDLGNIEGKIQDLVDGVKNFITKTFGISPDKQKEMLEQQSEQSSGLAAKISSSISKFVVGFILTLVYIFLFLFYRGHIKKFIRKVIPQKENTEDAIDRIEQVTQKYLRGMGIMIVCLWVMYSIGFTIIGLKNAFFFAIMCGLLEIVPFIGNFTGNLLAALMALTQGGGMPMVIGIIITYSIVQFLQTYILEPLVVGNGVNLNPLFTIMGLVLGELIWGITGLVLAIPLLAITKIVCDHIPALEPYGALIGREKTSGENIIEKIKGLFKKE